MIIIGEKINATRKGVAEAIEKRDSAAIAALAKSQDEAGADVIDVNSGSSRGSAADKIDDMRWLVEVVKNATKKPLAIDSENARVLSAGLEAASGVSRLWINSVSAEVNRIASVLPLVKKYSAPVVALCMDDGGIPKDVAGRLKAAEAIWVEGRKLGIAPELLYFDTLVMPIGADQNAGKMVLDTIVEIKRRFPGANTVVGLSNVSFGLPQRETLNYTFLSLCMGAGLDAAILDPNNEKVMIVLRAADALLGNDDYCMQYIRQHRKAKLAG